MFIIYEILNKLNGKSYVGFTSRTMNERWLEHCRSEKSVIGRAIQKYGKSVFSVGVLEEGWEPRTGLEIREPYWISVLRPEYNMTNGGEAPMMGLKHTEASKARIVLGQTGKKHPHKGSPKSVRTRATISAGLLGIKRSPEVKEARSVMQQGKKRGPYRLRVK